MSTENPTIMDVVAAEQSTTVEADPVLGVMDIIVRHQQAERDMIQGWQDAWLTEANTKVLLMQHGIASALDDCSWGVTTREYEIALAKIEHVKDSADRYHPAWEFYRAQVAESNGLIPLRPKTWPGFKTMGGFA